MAVAAQPLAWQPEVEAAEEVEVEVEVVARP